MASGCELHTAHGLLLQGFGVEERESVLHLLHLFLLLFLLSSFDKLAVGGQGPSTAFPLSIATRTDGLLLPFSLLFSPAPHAP